MTKKIDCVIQQNVHPNDRVIIIKESEINDTRTDI